MRKQTSILWLAGMTLGVIFGVAGLGVPVAFAQSASDDTLLNGFVEAVSLIYSALTMLAYIALFIVGKLLDPQILMYLLELDVINQMWRICRDITNAILAFVLVFAAVYTLVTAPSGGLGGNKIAKFVIGVIAVNFSWWFPRVILDVSHVLAASVFSLPSGFLEDNDIKNPTTGDSAKFVERIWLFPDPGPSAPGGHTGIPPSCFPHLLSPGASTDPNILTPIDGFLCVKLGPLSADANTGLGIVNGLYINFGKILSIDQLQNAGTGTSGTNGLIRNYIHFALKLLISFVYLIALSLPIIAMMVMFVVRLIILWMTVAFMPFIFIGYVLEEKDKVHTMEIFNKFVASAFLPVAVAVPLSLGYIMMALAANNPAGCPAQFGTLCEGIGGALIAGIHNWWDLFWSIAAIVVMWVGFFSALKIDSIYESIGGFFKGIGQNIGGSVLRNIPIPTPTGRFTTVGKAMDAGANMSVQRPIINVRQPFADTPATRPNRTQIEATVRQKIEAVVNSTGADRQKRIAALNTELQGVVENPQRLSRSIAEELQQNNNLTSDELFEKIKNELPED